MENFWGSPASFILVAVTVLALMAYWTRLYYTEAQNEITRFEYLINDNSLKPIKSEIEYQNSTGEFGAPLRIFTKGTIIFEHGLFFSTNNESAFVRIEESCFRKNPRFVVHERQNKYS